MKTIEPEVLSATTLIGNEVENGEGELLGKIEEIMIDRHTGDVAYAVLSFGGFMGLGEKLFAVPWQALTLDTDEQVFIFDVTKNRLEDAPGFDKKNWPRSGDREFVDLVYSYYAIPPYYTHRA
jgi:sporulation protein YlmC with PRC-barrel domain